MREMVYLIKLVCILLIVSGIKAALFGEQCTDSSDCTDVNTYCSKYRECGVGTCQCISGYGNANGNVCDKVLKHYNEACDSDNICLDPNQECNSTTALCACVKWNSYSYLAQQCITIITIPTEQVIPVLSQGCGGWWGIECYVNDTVGGLCDGTCQCQTGYTMALDETYLACRSPQWGEYCTSSVSCEVAFDTSTISDDSSSVPPRCLLNVCQCPPSHELKVVLGHNLCLNKNDAGYVLKDNGDTCTNFNECDSNLCVKCIGSSTGVCMADDMIEETPDDVAAGIFPNLILLATHVVYSFLS